jgi:hypothetical protein
MDKRVDVASSKAKQVQSLPGSLSHGAFYPPLLHPAAGVNNCAKVRSSMSACAATLATCLACWGEDDP